MIWDEELLVKKDQQSYVTNGLVIWLDGIDNTRSGHNASSSYWEDISGNGNDFRKSGTVNMTADNGYEFNKIAANYFYLENATATSVFGTYEIVFKVNTARGGYFGHNVLTDSGSGCVLYNHTSGTYLRFGQSYKKVNASDVPVDVVQSFSIIPTSSTTLTAYHNGIEYTTPLSYADTPGAGFNNNDNRIYIGKLNSANDLAVVGVIYAFRCYNRALTAAEIAQNATVDRIRYGIGV